jgi:hypothetical protein
MAARLATPDESRTAANAGLDPLIDDGGVLRAAKARRHIRVIST